jgi:hypothetical protein
MDHAIPDFLARLSMVFDAGVGPGSDLHFARASDSRHAAVVAISARKVGIGDVVGEA